MRASTDPAPLHGHSLSPGPAAIALGLALIMGLCSCATDATLRAIPVVGPGYRTPSDFRIVGYFPSWSGDPDLVQYRALTHINYAFLAPTMEGGYHPVDRPEKLELLVTYAHAYGVRVLGSLGGWNDGGPNAYDTIAADPGLTAAFCDATMALVERYDLDGIDMDWEFPKPATADNFARLMTALAERLHSCHKLLTIAVSATGYHGRDYSDELLSEVDFLNIMAYDDGYKQPGVHHSSYAYAEAAMRYWIVERGLPITKAVLGLPFYGRSLVNGHAVTYRSILSEDDDAAAKDVSGEYGYNGFDTIRSKTLDLAYANGGGVMIWQIAQDARGDRSLLNAIFDAVKESWMPPGSRLQ
ncbi:MAG TPA: glycosyl hydrolase family 18 protein [Rectinemataceae bacterium]|nr:glycosyl hydrolase family 18 protein [Rectinemataceae bacterium]